MKVKSWVGSFSDIKPGPLTTTNWVNKENLHGKRVGGGWVLVWTKHKTMVRLEDWASQNFRRAPTNRDLA